MGDLFISNLKISRFLSEWRWRSVDTEETVKVFLHTLHRYLLEPECVSP